MDTVDLHVHVVGCLFSFLYNVGSLYYLQCMCLMLINCLKLPFCSACRYTCNSIHVTSHVWEWLTTSWTISQRYSIPPSPSHPILFHISPLFIHVLLLSLLVDSVRTAPALVVRRYLKKWMQSLPVTKQMYAQSTVYGIAQHIDMYMCVLYNIHVQYTLILVRIFLCSGKDGCLTTEYSHGRACRPNCSWTCLYVLH